MTRPITIREAKEWNSWKLNIKLVRCRRMYCSREACRGRISQPPPIQSRDLFPKNSTNQKFGIMALLAWTGEHMVETPLIDHITTILRRFCRSIHPSSTMGDSWRCVIVPDAILADAPNSLGRWMGPDRISARFLKCEAEFAGVLSGRHDFGSKKTGVPHRFLMLSGFLRCGRG